MVKNNQELQTKCMTHFLQTQPKNSYVKYNIFVNLILNPINYKLNKDIFKENLNLLKHFPNNQNILIKYYDLAKQLKYNEWILFFETLLFQKKNTEKILNQLNKQTKDYNLKKIIKLYT